MPSSKPELDPPANVGAFMDDRRVVTWGRGMALAALDLLPPARRLLAARMIHGAPTALRGLHE